MEMKTVKQAIAELKKFIESGSSENIKDAGQFGKTVVDVLESLNFKVEALEREIGPSGAFIDPNDANNRLR